MDRIQIAKELVGIAKELTSVFEGIFERRDIKKLVDAVDNVWVHENVPELVKKINSEIGTSARKSGFTVPEFMAIWLDDQDSPHYERIQEALWEEDKEMEENLETAYDEGRRLERTGVAEARIRILNAIRNMRNAGMVLNQLAKAANALGMRTPLIF